MAYPSMGWRGVDGSTVAPLSVINPNLFAVSEPWDVAEDLAVLGRDVNRHDWLIVIPKFTIVAALATTRSTSGRTKLTIANGVGTNNPVGVVADNVARLDQNGPRGDIHNPNVLRHHYIETLYLSAVQDAFGNLVRGDYLAPDTQGRPVKFIERTTHVTAAAATGTSLTVDLAEATINGLPPVDVEVLEVDSGAPSLFASANVGTPAYSTGDGFYQVALSSTTNGRQYIVSYTTGHAEAMRVGQVTGIETLTDMASDWIRWVEAATFPGAFQWYAQPRLYTAVSNEVISLDDEGSEVSLTYSNLDPLYPITVEYASDGATYVKQETLSISGIWNNGWHGTYYQVNLRDGTITLDDDYFDTTACTAATLRVSYAYQYPYGLGSLGPTGIPGLTDGRTSGGGAGVQAAYDVSGSAGRLKWEVIC